MAVSMIGVTVLPEEQEAFHRIQAGLQNLAYAIGTGTTDDLREGAALIQDAADQLQMLADRIEMEARGDDDGWDQILRAA